MGSYVHTIPPVKAQAPCLPNWIQAQATQLLYWVLSGAI